MMNAPRVKANPVRPRNDGLFWLTVAVLCIALLPIVNALHVLGYLG